MPYQLDELYPEGVPIIVQVGFRHGYGPAIVELNRKVDRTVQHRANLLHLQHMQGTQV